LIALRTGASWIQIASNYFDAFVELASFAIFWWNEIHWREGAMSARAKVLRTSWSWTEWVSSGILVLLLGMLVLSTTCGCGGGDSFTKGSLTKSIANCRQIILSIRLYAADHDGAYPDAGLPLATDSNTVFRQLIITGELEDEKIFGCGASRFVPDGDIGNAPDFSRAVQPGENHWAMTKGLNDNSPGEMPLVYENPTDAAWPPAWNADAAGRSVKGRTWSGGKVIIGTNDTSVELMKLESSKGSNVPLKPMKSDGLNLFERYSQTPDDTLSEILDVAETKEAPN
jgi:hypothetical protein